jgi:hypothetical protein
MRLWHKKNGKGKNMFDILLLNRVINEPEELVCKFMHCLFLILEVKI